MHSAKLGVCLQRLGPLSKSELWQANSAEPKPLTQTIVKRLSQIHHHARVPCMGPPVTDHYLNGLKKVKFVFVNGDKLQKRKGRVTSSAIQDLAESPSLTEFAAAEL